LYNSELVELLVELEFQFIDIFVDRVEVPRELSFSWKAHRLIKLGCVTVS
jgi:hypothetical protein